MPSSDDDQPVAAADPMQEEYIRFPAEGDSCIITQEDYLLLNSGEWLNDNIIDFYLK